MTRTRNDCSSRAIRREIEREENFAQRVKPIVDSPRWGQILPQRPTYGAPRVRRS